MPRGPKGTVTFLLTDIVGSTRLWEESAAEMQLAVERHDEILRAAIERRGGYVFSRGEAFAAVFEDAADAVDAAVDAQQRFADEHWPEPTQLAVRMGLQTGEALERNGDYFGPVLHRAARIMAAGHGGQIIVGTRTASLLEDFELIDLGEHGLKDISGSERLFQVCAANLATEFPALLTRDARRGNLPIPTTRLVGRDMIVPDLIDVVRTNRLVTFTGVGGVGKTRLAIEVGGELAGDFPDGVWLVELAPVGDGASVPDAIATALGIAPRAGESVIDTLADALSSRRMLLVLDNCEHVVNAAADAVENVLSRSGSVKVLATSREGLRVVGEQRRLVPPLTLDGGTESPAVTLFVERAREAVPRFALNDPEAAEAVIEICRRLDGLALGIELAAARMGSMTPSDMRDRLDNRFRILAGSTRRPERQQTLHDVVGWSYDLLDDGERDVLRCSSVFAGGFSLPAITDVVGDKEEHEVLGALDSLVHKSLVVADVTTGRARYVLLETVRQFAEDELSTAGTLAGIRDRHAAYFASAAVAHWDVWNGAGWRDAVDWVEVELPNLRAAFRWSAGRGHVEIAADIAAHAAMLGVSVQLFEPVGWAEEIAEAAAQADIRCLPRVYTAAGYACFIGRPEQAVAATQTAQRLEKEARYDPFFHGMAGLIEALSQVYAGHLDLYVEITGRLAALPPPARAFGLPAYVDGLQASGRVDEAMALADEALAAARAQENPYFIAYATWIYGSAFAATDPTRALTVWREGLRYVQEHRVNFFVGFIARDAAGLELVDADPEVALTMFDVAIESFQQAGAVAQLTITLASATSLFERIGRLEDACTLYGAISRQPGSEHHVPDLPHLAQRLATALGADRFRECDSAGSVMDLSDAARYARGQIQQARAALQRGSGRAERPGGLSRREIEVLCLAAQGLTTQDIATQLFISPKTADRHIQNVYTKIGVSNRVGAALWAVQHGVID